VAFDENSFAQRKFRILIRTQVLHLNKHRATDKNAIFDNGQEESSPLIFLTIVAFVTILLIILCKHRKSSTIHLLGGIGNLRDFEVGIRLVY
jgi:hypothetical protein